jgi:hypothetical protein
MSELRKFLVVTREQGHDRCSIFFDELPRLTQLTGPIIYKLELLGRWRHRPLQVIEAAYWLHKERGTLPADNTDPKKRPRVRAQLAGEIVPFVGVSK